MRPDRRPWNNPRSSAVPGRCLGRERGDQYAAAAAASTMDSVPVRIRPEHWLTVGYGKEAGA